MSSRPTRRQLLATMLGAPAALTLGCGLRSAKTMPAGEIVGTSLTAGHRFRDGYRPTPNHWEEVEVAIIGGGVAGLSAGWRLQRAGFDRFVLLELEEEVGGTARSSASRLTPYPWGAHYLPTPLPSNRSLIALLQELRVVESIDPDGVPVVAEQYLCRDPEERLFQNGQWHEGLYPISGATAADHVDLKRFEERIAYWVAWRDDQDRRAFTIPVALCSDDPKVTALDQRTMAQWLQEEGLQSQRLRWMVDYACRDDYGMTVEQTSAWAGLFYFCSRIDKPGAASQPLITWPEGNGWLVSRLRKAMTSQIRSGWAVADLWETAEQGVSLAAFSSRDGAILGLRAEQVIFAAPRFVAPYVIRSLHQDRPKYLAEFEYGSWMVANLHLYSRPQDNGFPLAWDNVFFDGPSLGYVVATHQRGPDHGPTILTYYYPLCDDDPRSARRRLESTTWNEWVEMIIADIATVHPEIRDLVERIDVMRWGHAMIRPRPGFIWSPARQQAQAPLGNIHFAHSDMSGIPLFEEAFFHGVRAAEEILVARGHAFAPLG